MLSAMDALPRQLGWTRGQFALWQAALGCYLASWLVGQLPSLLAILGLLLAVAFVLGWKTRLAAGLLWLPLAAMPGSPLAGWLLWVSCLLPAIRSKDWHMPRPVWWGSWLGLAGIYAYSAYCGVLFFVPTLILLHLLAINPRWLRSSQRECLLFYDGECGLCHRAVRFVLSEDLDAMCKLAPLQGETFAALELPAVPDSIALKDGERILWRSSAVVSLLCRLGGYWRVLGWLLWCVPKPLRDLGYMAFARVRHHFFKKPQGLCPLIPPELQTRFQR
jgi:predicted DCC family thiol-disulfide oxidoreductase YuxK